MPTSLCCPTTTARRFRPRRSNARPVTILGTGSCVPERIVDNDFFSSELGIDTNSEWIEQRIGIQERRWSVQETSTDLAVGAARSALLRANLDAADIDLIVVATSTPDFTMPSTASLVQGRLGAEHAMGFDVVNACAGFVSAMDATTRYFSHGDVCNALVIGVDRGSRLVDFNDRTTTVIFGDGAGAAVISGGGRGRILASSLHSRGTSEPLSVPIGGAMAMDGRAVWNFATQVLPETVRELCDMAGIAVNDIDLLVPHQANRNIIAAGAEELGLPLDRVAVNIDRFGNTLAASIPMALEEAVSSGRVHAGNKVALVGFGAGLAWGGLLLEI